MIRLPRGGVAVAGLQDRWGYEDLAADLMHDYLAPVRRQYQVRCTARMAAGRAPSVAELFGRARAEYTGRLFEQAAVEALFLGVAGG